MFDHHSPVGFLQKAKDALETSRDWAETGQHLAMTGSQRAKRFIDKKPMTATLMALGIGYLLGKVFSTRKPAIRLPSLAKGAKRPR
jgi:hypothetical protein